MSRARPVLNRREESIVWYTPNDSKPVLAVPRSMVPELLALVQTLHGHPGVGATLAVVRSHFYWPTIARDTRLYVASCGCNRRKRFRSQKIATMPGQAVQPWETLQVDILSMGTTSRTGNKHILLVVDCASRFPFAFPLPSKGTKEVARILANLCLTFGVPRNFRSDGGGEFRSEILKPLSLAESQTGRWTRRPLPRPRCRRKVRRVAPRDVGGAM